jgi:hypothetical protein
MNIYPLLVIFFSLFLLGFGLYLYTRRKGAASLMGSIFCLVGLILILITVIAWLLPRFFYNIS